MTLSLAIVSDIHCHPKSSEYSDTLLFSDISYKPEKQNPAASLHQLIQEDGLKADILLMPGDMTNRADQQGINTAWATIESFAAQLNAPLIASTIGNHDVAWQDPRDDVFRLGKNLHPHFPSKSNELSERFWSDGFFFEEQPNYRILIINSAQNHTSQESAKKGSITERQLESIDTYLQSAEKKKYQIALCHHHPIQHEEITLGSVDLMTNGSRLVELLSRNRFSILIHGHKHHPRIRIDTSGGNTLPIFAAGSFAAGLKEGLGTRTRNVFHMIELNCDTAHNQVVGVIKTWQFQLQLGWTRAEQSAADFPFITGFGSGITAEELAGKIEHAFSGFSEEVVLWEKIVTIVPQIKWTPPAVFRAAAELLQGKGITLYPSAPNWPKCIGIEK